MSTPTYTVSGANIRMRRDGVQGIVIESQDGKHQYLNTGDLTDTQWLHGFIGLLLDKWPHPIGVTASGPRYFADDDPVNTPIPQTPTVDPNSDRWVTKLATYKSQTTVSTDENWGYNVVHAVDTDPVVAVTSGPSSAAWFPRNQFMMHLPASAQANKGSDGHLIVIEPDGVMATEFWQFSRSGDKVSCSTVWQFRVDQAHGSSSSQIDGYYGGVCAANLSMLAGTITVADFQAGKINHALGFAYNYTGTGVRLPAHAGDGHNPDGLPSGARVYLPRSVDISHLTGLEWMIADALQEYGMIQKDTTGNGIELFAEHVASPPDGYTALNGEGSLAGIPWSQCRVLAA